jgi:hypothetical protein
MRWTNTFLCGKSPKKRGMLDEKKEIVAQNMRITDSKMCIWGMVPFLMQRQVVD